MIIGNYASCQTCGQKYILRIGLGLESYQPHTFDCKSCELPISLSIRRNSPSGIFQAEENIIFEENEPQNGIVINLHPFFAFNSSEIHTRTAVPSLLYIVKISPYLRRVPEGTYYQGSTNQDVGLQFDLPDASNLWTIVKNIFILRKNPKQSKNLNKLIKSYQKHRREYFSKVTVSKPKEVACDFFDSLFYPRLQEFIDPANNLIQKIKRSYPEKFSYFLQFYSTNLKQEHLKQYLSIFSDYFNVYYQFKQILIHSRISDEDVDDKIVGSKSFEIIKLYYGQAYESITSLFVVFACLNNVWMGRNYDQFQNMKLNKYITINKSKRADCFKDTQQFYRFTDGLDNTLRNGSHHSSIWRDGEEIYYRSGGTGDQREIPYSRYLHLCNKLTISLAALFMIELELQNM